MSDLRPRGTPINLGGKERYLLFTLNVIDEIQDRYNKNLHEIINDLTREDVASHTLRDLVTILLNDEAAKRAEPGALEQVTEKDVGEMIGLDNYYQVTAAILAAYGISLPQPEEDDDPNRTSGQQSS